MESLDAIAVKHSSDKSFLLPGRNGHGYAQHYARFFDEFRDLPIRFLEIGVDKGFSTRMWSEYFSRAELFGIDINPKCSEVIAPRTTIVIGDQTKDDFWNGFIAKHGSGWNVIVDDGGHHADQILISLTCLWPHVARGGYYCVEDIGTAYPNYVQGRILCTEVYMTNCIPDGFPNHMDVLKGKIDAINLGTEIEFAFFSKELAILRKSQ